MMETVVEHSSLPEIGSSTADSVKDEIVAPSKGHVREYELKRLRAQNDSLQQETFRLRTLLQNLALVQANRVEKRSNIINPTSHTVEDRGKVQIQPMGRCASMSTKEALLKVENSNSSIIESVAVNVVQACKNPLTCVEYLCSQDFASDLIDLCHSVRDYFEQETRCLFLQSPIYVFGDIHGNLEDLNFFSDNLWTLGLPLTAGKFLFLGDYVDRGMHSVEVIAYMFALKLQCPDKVFMLRGNHELRDVNGWEEHYGNKSFLWQCKSRFGDKMGETVWEEVNQVFDRLPLSAVIDNDIFCVHGGIPRPVKGNNNSRIEDILLVPPVAGVSPYYAHETEETVRVASECLWSDPARSENEIRLDSDGYGQGPRGVGAVCFGSKAVDVFLEQHGYSYIVRAHEAHSEGVALSKGARVFTVFSTSKDHNQGRSAMAGCILVDNDEIRIINRSPKYKNRVIRRRSSAVHMGLGPQWTEQGRKLGLIIDTNSSNDLLYMQRKSSQGRAHSPAATAAIVGRKLFSGLFGSTSGGQPVASSNSNLCNKNVTSRSPPKIRPSIGNNGDCISNQTMRGLNSRDEDTDRKFVDFFVESWDIEGCSSASSSDDELEVKANISMKQKFRSSIHQPIVFSSALHPVESCAPSVVPDLSKMTHPHTIVATMDM